MEWNINSQSQMLVMIAPADVALYVCPPGTKGAWAAAMLVEEASGESA